MAVNRRQVRKVKYFDRLAYVAIHRLLFGHSWLNLALR